MVAEVDDLRSAARRNQPTRPAVAAARAGYNDAVLVACTPLPFDVRAELAGVEVVTAAGAALRGAAMAADGVVCLLSDPIDRALLAAAPRLRVVANVAVGVDNIDVAAATELGVCVANTPDVLTEATADLTWALILAAARRLGEGERLVRAGRFAGWALDLLLGVDVGGATLGIFGMGRIGRAVARRAAGFAMPVLYCGGRAEAGSPAQEVGRDELLARADVVTIHTPLTTGSRHLIDRAALAHMKPTAVLINTARGACVDEDAVVDALEAGRLFAAGFDVFVGEPAINPRLRDSERVVLAPHIGSATTSARTRMARLATRAARDVLLARRPDNLVNPEVWPVRRGADAAGRAEERS